MFHGIFLMIAAVALLSTMDAMAKWLLTHQVSVIQILALRSVVIVPLMLTIFFSKRQIQRLQPVRPKAHLLRGLVGCGAPLAFFIGIRHIPLTDAVVLFFSSVFIISLLSMAFLGERIGPHRWASIIVGFTGVWITANPGGGGGLWGYVLVLIGSTCYAILFVSGRYLSRTESVGSLVFSFNLSVGALSLALLPWFWQPLQVDDYVLIGLISLFAVSGHFCMTAAFSTSEASLIAPFEYTAVIWAILFDLLVWQHFPTITTGVGAIIIIGSGLYLAHRERIKQRTLLVTNR